MAPLGPRMPNANLLDPAVRSRREKNELETWPENPRSWVTRNRLKLGHVEKKYWNWRCLHGPASQRRHRTSYWSVEPFRPYHRLMQNTARRGGVSVNFLTTKRTAPGEQWFRPYIIISLKILLLVVIVGLFPKEWLECEQKSIFTPRTS